MHLQQWFELYWLFMRSTYEIEVPLINVYESILIYRLSQNLIPKTWWVLRSSSSYCHIKTEVDKKPKKIENCLAWISDNLKTVCQGESGELNFLLVFAILSVGPHKCVFTLQIAWLDCLSKDKGILCPHFVHYQSLYQ